MKSINIKCGAIFIVMLMFLMPTYADNRTLGNLTDFINDSNEFNITKGNDTIDPGVTPDSVWYFLDVFFDDLRLALANSDEDKIKLELEIAEERLAEVNDMALQGDITGMIKAEKNHEKIFIKLQEEIQSRNESEIDVEEDVRNRFEHHNTEVQRIKGDLDIFVRSKGDLTLAQESAIATLIASFEGKEGKIKINIDNDNGKATIRVKMDKEKDDEEENESCYGLNEISCISNDDCSPVYGEECNANLTLAAECITDIVFKKCDKSSDDDLDDNDDDDSDDLDDEEQDDD